MSNYFKLLITFCVDAKPVVASVHPEITDVQLSGSIYNGTLFLYESGIPLPLHCMCDLNCNDNNNGGGEAGSDDGLECKLYDLNDK